MNKSITRHIERFKAPPLPSGKSSSARLDEMRNCLAPILTSAVIARSLSADRRQALALDIIERQTARLVHLVNEAFDDEPKHAGRSRLSRN